MGFTTRLFAIPYQHKMIEAAYTSDEQILQKSHTAIILTHGAGGDMRLPQLEKLTNCLAEHGFILIRFTCKGLNLAYRIKVYTKVLEFINKEYPSISNCFIGGRSMGARAAVGTILALSDSPLASWICGVVCLSYPLYTQNNMTILRDGPLLETSKPLCFISGTSDEMCDKGLMVRILDKVHNAKMMWIDGADHSMKVKGRTEDAVVGEMFDCVNKWCEEVLQMKVAKKTDEKSAHERLTQKLSTSDNGKKVKSVKRKRDA